MASSLDGLPLNSSRKGTLYHYEKDGHWGNFSDPGVDSAATSGGAGSSATGLKRRNIAKKCAAWKERCDYLKGDILAQGYKISTGYMWV